MLELVNSLLLCVLATDALTRQSLSLARVAALVGPVAVFNAAAFVVPTLLHSQLKVPRTTPLGTLLNFTLEISSLAAPARVVVLAWAYFVVAYIDIRARLRARALRSGDEEGCAAALPLRSFAVRFLVAALQTALIFPVAGVVAATAMMAVVLACDVLGISTDGGVMNALVYYGVMYAPWSVVYFLTKRACLSSPIAQKRHFEHEQAALSAISKAVHRALDGVGECSALKLPR